MSCGDCPNKGKCKTKLTVVEEESKAQLPEQHNFFWNSCPQKYEYIPDSPCQFGKDEDCDWWINSPKDNYCFWRYVQKNSDPEGNMRALSQPQIAKLLNCSSPQVHVIMREALKKLKDSGHLEYLLELTNMVIPEDEV